MKLTVLGCGVRAPFLMKTLVLNAKALDVDHIVFIDVLEERLALFGKLSEELAHQMDPSLQITLTTDPREALRDTDYIISAIRVGGDEGRVFDEKLAQKYQILGQETTGIGGFAMSLRSIPTLIDYMKIAKEVAAPNHILFNFTNPSAIVTQALHGAGFQNVYGICDGPTSFHRQLAQMVGVSMEEFDVTCYGLNHLSFYRNCKIRGIPSDAEVLEHPKLFQETEMKIFQKDVVPFLSGELPNEYFYFFLYNRSVIASIAKNGGARGEVIAGINMRLIGALKEHAADSFEKRFQIYMTHLMERENSYFAIESGGKRENHKEVLSVEAFIAAPDEGGYSGIALNIIRGTKGLPAPPMTVLVPNNGCISGLCSEDIIEITCDFMDGKVVPRKIDHIPSVQLSYIQTVKTYERLTAEAILEKNRMKAIRGLTIHPLVADNQLANTLLDTLLSEYARYIGEWV